MQIIIKMSYQCHNNSERIFLRYVSNHEYSVTTSASTRSSPPSERLPTAPFSKIKHPQVSGSCPRSGRRIPDEHNTARSMHGKILNNLNTVDNDLVASFIKKRVYKGKSRCYVCGAEGHLSYKCPRNQLGPSERPEEKKRQWRLDGDDESVMEFEFDDGNWPSAVIVGRRKGC